MSVLFPILLVSPLLTLESARRSGMIGTGTIGSESSRYPLGSPILIYDIARFDILAIEKTLFDKKFTAAPGDLKFLVHHLRELPEDARKFVIWASFFGPT